MSEQAAARQEQPNERAEIDEVLAGYANGTMAFFEARSRMYRLLHATPAPVTQPIAQSEVRIETECPLCRAGLLVSAHEDGSALVLMSHEPPPPPEDEREVRCNVCGVLRFVRGEVAPVRTNAQPTDAALRETLGRARYVLWAILSDMPEKRDWLDPDIEREARALTRTPPAQEER